MCMLAYVRGRGEELGGGGKRKGKKEGETECTAKIYVCIGSRYLALHKGGNASMCPMVVFGGCLVVD